MALRKALAAAVAGTLLLGQASAQTPTGPKLTLTQAEAELLSGRLKGADRPDLSIAMSGGGIRSSLFNIGVLKALYDQGLLAETDLISSVSGGSYTSYWLYGNQLADPSAPFGARSLDDAHFPQRVCEIITSGNFVSYGNMAKSALRGFPGLREMYLSSLVRTYGQTDSHTAPYDIRQIHALVSEHQAPYPIVNATINNRPQKSQSWSSRLFEFTPIHYGNRSRGFVPWGERDHPLRLAAITSGAALSPLDRKFAQPYPDSEKGSYAKLGDGGKTENLGAIAPILRGSRHLIVIDAQLDPRDEPFEAYLRLKEHLKGLGGSLQVADIEGPQARQRAVFAGTVATPESRTDIAYIKMRVPDALRRAFAAPPRSTVAAGLDFEQRYYDTLRKNKIGKNWQCSAVANFDGDVRSWLFQNTSSYLAWSEGHGFYRTLDRIAPDQQEFPQHTTADQSFYLDQAVAYIGLGYLVTMSEEGQRVLARVRPAAAGASAATQ